MTRRRLGLPAHEIARRYGAGESLAALASAYGCSTKPITRRLREQGIEPHRQRLDLPESEIARRYEAGESTRALGRAYGCGHITIANRLRALGVRMRYRRAPRRSPESERLETNTQDR